MVPWKRCYLLKDNFVLHEKQFILENLKIVSSSSGVELQMLQMFNC